MEIGIIIAVILFAFAFAMAKTSAGVVVIELAKLGWAALMLGIVVAAAMIAPRRTARAG